MSAQPPKPEAENAEPAPPADAVGGGTKGREFPDFAADDPEPGDWIAPGEVLKQEPITIASDTTVPKTNAPSKSTAKDSVEKDGTDKEMPDNTEFIVKDEIVSEEGDGATKTEKSSYFCETCQETSPGTEEEHLEGRRHLKTQERLEKYGSLQKIAEVFKTSYCFICGAKSNSLEQFEIHVKGNKHKTRCKTFDLDPSLTNFPPGMKIPPGVKPPPGYASPGTKEPQHPAPKGPPAPKPSAAAAPAAKKNASQAPGTKDPGDGTGVRAERPVCDVCSITLSSPQQLLQHLSGKRHKDLVESLKAGARLPRKKPQPFKGPGGRPDGMPPSGPPMRPPAAPKSGNFDQGVPKGAKRPLLLDGGPGPFKKPNMGPGGAATAPGTPGGPPVLKKSFYCKLCNATLNSEFQRDEHMNGRAHKERLTSGQPAAQQGPQSQQKPQFQPRAQFQPRPQFQSKPPFQPKPQFQPRSQFQQNRPQLPFRQPQPNWGAHQNQPFQGKQNQGFGPRPRGGMAQQRMPAPKGTFSCQPCQQTMNSKMQYDQHMTSKKHFQNLETLASGGSVSIAPKKPLIGGPNTPGGPPNIRPRAPNVYSTAKPWSTSNSSKPTPFNSGGNRFGAPQQQPWTKPNTRPQQQPQYNNGSVRPPPSNQPVFPTPGAQQFQTNARPQQKPLLGGLGFGPTPSDQFSKLQYDLAVEISKLSRQLTRPDLAQEIGQQLNRQAQQTSQQEHLSMDTPLERPMEFDRSHDYSYGDAMDQSHTGHDFNSGNMYGHDYQEPHEGAPYKDVLEPPTAAPRRTLLPSSAQAFEGPSVLDRLKKMSGSAQSMTIDTYGERRPHDQSDYEYGSSELGFSNRGGYDEYPAAEFNRPLLSDRGRSEGLLGPSSSLLGRPFDYNSRF